MRAKSDRKNYIWNSVAGLMNAGQSVILLMVIRRIYSLDMAGIFAIAFATANLFLNPGNFGVRNYQATDINEKYRFFDYICHRILVTTVMFIAAVAYLFFSITQKGYSAEKAWVFLMMFLYKTVDCYEEVFDGRLQQMGYLYLANQIVVARLSISTITIVVVSLLTHDIVLSLICGTIAALAISLMMLYARHVEIAYRRARFSMQAVKGILLNCLPLFLGYFMSLYLSNAPKYAIDALQSEQQQAIYNFIAMPAFVINLLNTFIYQPILISLREAWVQQDDKRFLGLVRRVMLWLMVIALTTLAGGYLVGIRLLSIFYSVDLNAYKHALMIILVGSVFLAISGFCCAILTTLRKQICIPFSYLVAVVASLFITNRLVVDRGVEGAAVAYLVLMLIVSVFAVMTTMLCVFRGLKCK